MADNTPQVWTKAEQQKAKNDQRMSANAQQGNMILTWAENYVSLRQQQYIPDTPEVLKDAGLAYLNYMSRRYDTTPEDIESSAKNMHLRGELEKLVD